MKKWYGTHRIQLRSPTGLPTWKSTPENIQNKAKNKRKSRKKGDREFYRQCEIKIGEGKCDHINLVKSFSPFVGHFFLYWVLPWRLDCQWDCPVARWSTSWCCWTLDRAIPPFRSAMTTSYANYIWIEHQGMGGGEHQNYRQLPLRR